MRRCGYVSVSVLLMFLGGCASNMPKKGDTLVESHPSYKIVKDTQKHFYVLQNGHLLYTNLHYAQSYGHNTVVALDAHNKIKFLKLQELKNTKIENSDEPLLLCGNSEYTHHLSSEKRKNNILIFASVHLNGDSTHVIQKKKRIVSIPLKKADRVFFAEGKNELELEGDTIGDIYVYFQKGAQYGFLGKLESVYEKEEFNYIFRESTHKVLYDGLKEEDVSGNVLLRKSGLLGYYLKKENRFIEPKYKSLQPYNLTYGLLARFELPDGRKGYVDLKGNEYYD